MPKTTRSVTRPERLEGAAMNYAPVNELGVVLLFAQVAKKYRIRVDSIQARFPDCIAYQSIGGKAKELRIEFEFRSKSFEVHRHDQKKCDMIVCWEHDWVRCPPRIRVLELQARVRARVQRLDPAGERRVREGSGGWRFILGLVGGTPRDGGGPGALLPDATAEVHRRRVSALRAGVLGPSRTALKERSPPTTKDEPVDQGYGSLRTDPAGVPAGGAGILRGPETRQDPEHGRVRARTDAGAAECERVLAVPARDDRAEESGGAAEAAEVSGRAVTLALMRVVRMVCKPDVWVALRLLNKRTHEMHTRTKAQGFKRERERTWRVPKSRFTPIEGMAGLVETLLDAPSRG